MMYMYSVVYNMALWFALNLALFPDPIPSFSMLHTEAFQCCTLFSRAYVEKIGEPGNEATLNLQFMVVILN